MAQCTDALAMQVWQPEFDSWNPRKGGGESQLPREHVNTAHAHYTYTYNNKNLKS